MLVVLRS